MRLEETLQTDLLLSDTDVLRLKVEPRLTVDHLEVAQFIHFFLRSPSIGRLVERLNSRFVLILGQFDGERAPVLEAIKEAVRQRTYSLVFLAVEPVQKPTFTPILSRLTRLARFILVDITNAQAILPELQRMVADLPSVPVQLLVQSQAEQDTLSEGVKEDTAVFTVHPYRHADEVTVLMQDTIIDLAE
jgi:hypothetical protein